ncbi:hypothetical protein [Halalkalicoccus tibetensis]|uniref:Uncharacterized protein n=1 Tax=Halalkalicoccus tibetensis TaxID=175632 RepID=A0ABD5VBB5_9EURY
MEKITAGVDLDVAYGRTPEDALMSVLAIQPAFDYREAYYVDERPAFMDVVADRRFNKHDWDQYEQVDAESLTNRRGDGVRFQKRLRYDAPLTPDQRFQIILTNIWLEVPYSDDGRAHARFDFSITLRESELDGEDELRDGDHYWRCERMSTEPIDETRR